MRYVSTRREDDTGASFEDVLLAGLARDGGRQDAAVAGRRGVLCPGPVAQPVIDDRVPVRDPGGFAGANATTRAKPT